MMINNLTVQKGLPFRIEQNVNLGGLGNDAKNFVCLVGTLYVGDDGAGNGVGAGICGG